MADHTITGSSNAWHGVVGTAVETITFDRDENTIEVISADGSGDLYYTLDGTDPTIAGANSYIVPAGAIGMDLRQPRSAAVSVIKLIATAPTRVSVQRGN